MPVNRQSRQSPLEKEPILLQPPVEKVQQQQSRSQGQEERPGSSNTGGDDRKDFRGRERDWYDYFDKRFGPIVIILLWFFMPLDRATFYAPSPEECHALAPHMARVIPKLEDAINRVLRLPAWAHDVAIGSDSMIQIGFITMGYLDRIGLLENLAPYFTNSAARMRRNVNEQGTGHTSGLHENNNTNGPVDLSAVRGLGEQYRP